MKMKRVDEQQPELDESVEQPEPDEDTARQPEQQEIATRYVKNVQSRVRYTSHNIVQKCQFKSASTWCVLLMKSRKGGK